MPLVTKHGCGSFFIRFNSVSEGFDSAHDSQSLYKTWFKSTRDSKWISEIWSQLTTQKGSRILIQINSRLIFFQNLDSNQLMAQWCYSFPVPCDLFWSFNWTIDLVDLLWTFHSSLDFVWPFLGLRLKRLPRANWFESSHYSTSISETWIDSTHDSSGFPWIDSESTHDSSGFPGIDPDKLMTQNASIFFNSNQLMTQAKYI